MNTQNVNVNTATPESPKTWVEGQGPAELSHAQFLDLYDFVRMNGTFTGISGVKGAQLARLDMLEEPTEEPEARSFTCMNNGRLRSTNTISGTSSSAGCLTLNNFIRRG